MPHNDHGRDSPASICLASIESAHKDHGSQHESDIYRSPGAKLGMLLMWTYHWGSGLGGAGKGGVARYLDMGVAWGILKHTAMSIPVK